MSATPLCSVIVPTRGRPQALRRCVAAVAGQDYPGSRFELIVVHDGGPADPSGLARVAGAVPLTVLRRAWSGPAAARNAGARAAAGELLAFTDDDCEPEPGWLSALAARAGLAAVGGRTVNGLPANACAAFSRLVISTGYAHNNRDPDDARFFASNNLAVAAEALAAVGGFDERFRTSEDRDLCDRLRVAGGKLAYEPRAVVRHLHDLSLRGFWRQQLDYGRGARTYHAAHAARHDGRRVRLEPGFYRTLAAEAWRTRASVAGGLRAEALLAVWAAANAVGYARGWPAAAADPGGAAGEAPAPARA